jgi:antitoxin HigA-1
LPITEDEDRLNNVHPGDILRHDFLIGSDIPTDEVADGTGLPASMLDAIMDRRRPIDASVDLRLARYFGMSEGFFLGLQIDFDLEEERRAHGAELDRIVRRAA